MLNDRYEVQAPRLDVYATDAGQDAKPVRSFPAPRQLTIMQSGDDGTLYVAGADVYKVDVKTGKFDVLIPSRHWKRPNYSAPDVLYVWNHRPTAMTSRCSTPQRNSRTRNRTRPPPNTSTGCSAST